MSKIQTFSGRVVDFRNLDPNSIHMLDIAWHLSNLCRFTGAVKRFYSVAEHSVNVASIVPRNLKWVALLHDATEAYINDVSRPLKQLPAMSDYRDIERELWFVICHRYDLPFYSVGVPEAVHNADQEMFVVEQADLMPPHPELNPAAPSVLAIAPVPLGLEPRVAFFWFCRMVRDYNRDVYNQELRPFLEGGFKQ